MPNRNVDINVANLDELAHITGVGRQRAQDLLKARPFSNWDDIKRVPGFSNRLIEQMQNYGATIGEAARTAGRGN